MTDEQKEYLLENVRMTPGFASPPYSVESFPIGACVVNSQGFNLLSFKDAPGAKFLPTEEMAQIVCDQWNGVTR